MDNIKIYYNKTYANILHRLRSSKSIEDNFQEIISDCIKFVPTITDIAVAHAFGIGVTSVQRWMEGKNLPLHNVRPQIYKWLATQLELYLIESDIKCFAESEITPT